MQLIMTKRFNKLNIEKQITKQINNLYTLECELETSSSSLSDKSLDLDIENQVLLNLSRLMTGPDVCGAISVESNAQLNFANNTGSDAHFKKIIEQLAKLIEKPESLNEVRKDLIKIASEKGADYHKSAASIELYNELKTLSKDKSINKKIIPIIEDALASIKKYLKNSVKTKKDSLSDFIDKIGQVQVSSIENNNIFSKLDKHYKNLHQDIENVLSGIVYNKSPKLIEAIKQKQFLFVDNPNKGVHAEIKLLTKIINKKDEKSLIITSKLCCNACKNCINSAQDILKKKIKTIGTHGKTYPGWKFPKELHSKLLIDLNKKLKRDYNILIQKRSKIIQKSKETFSQFNQPDAEGFVQFISKNKRTQLKEEFLNKEKITAKQKGEVLHQKSDAPKYLLEARKLGYKIKTVSTSRNSSKKVLNIKPKSRSFKI